MYQTTGISSSTEVKYFCNVGVGQLPW